MRGVGGPLLCIGDLLGDLDQKSDDGGDFVASVNPTFHHHHQQQQLQQPTSPPSISSDFDHVHPFHLPKLFEDNYEQLNKALAGTDHSWTALTLKLCTALETANHLIQSTNSHARVLSEKVEELEKMISRRDSAIAQVKAVEDSQKHSGAAVPEEKSYRCLRITENLHHLALQDTPENVEEQEPSRHERCQVTKQV